MNPLHKLIKEIGEGRWTTYDYCNTREREDGTKLDDYFTMEGSRYTFDGMLCGVDDWEQFDTGEDAHYFGVWYSMENKMTVTYAEGDLCVAYNIPDMEVEYKKMVDCYGEPPPAFTVIDKDGTVTKHYSR